MKVINRTRFKPGNVRFDSLVEEARRELESWLVYNPSRRESAWIEVTYAGGGIYAARGRYSAGPGMGTSSPVCVYSRPVAVGA
jgi:hypothetical protein